MQRIENGRKVKDMKMYGAGNARNEQCKGWKMSWNMNWLLPPRNADLPNLTHPAETPACWIPSPAHRPHRKNLPHFTVRLHAMQTHGIAVAILPVCLSVRPSVRRVYCDETKWCAADILIPHDTATTLVFWHQHWSVGDAPFPMKSALKVTHPLEKRRLRPISAHNVSTVRDSEKKFHYDEYKVDHGLFNEP